MFSIFFNQVLIFTILRRHQLFLSKNFQVKAAIGRPLRWTKCKLKSDFFFFSLFLVFLHFVMWFCCFFFPKFWMILPFVTVNWLRIVNAILFGLLKCIDYEHFLSLFVEYQKSKEVFNVVILLLLHPIYLVKFLLEIYCAFLKSFCYFYFSHSITNNRHFHH